MVLNSNTLDFLWLQDGSNGTAGADGSSLYTWVKYSQAADGSNMTDNPTGAVYIGIAYNKTSATESTDPLDYSWTLIKGADGNDGEDAYTIVLSNENISFSTDKTNLPLTNQSATCGITIYKGTTQVTNYTIGTINAPTGIGVSKNSNSVTVSVSSSTYVTNDSGLIEVPITIGGITITKKIAYSLSKQGDDGRGIASTTVQYQASSSGTTPPSGNWYNAIPTVSPSQFLWTRTAITYDDVAQTTVYIYSVSKDGKGVATVTNEYKISTNNQNPNAGRSDGSTSQWTSVRPNDLDEDEYLWIRYKYTYDDGSSPTYSDPIYDSTIDGVSSVIDAQNRTIKSSVWETAYFNVVDEDTGTVTQMNIKDTIVENTMDISGITSRVSTAEGNIDTVSTTATQTATDFSWVFQKNAQTNQITFTQNGINLVHGAIEVKAPDGQTTVISGGQINTNNIANTAGTSWINLGLGTFNFSDKLIWDDSELIVYGDVNATSGYIGGDSGWKIETQKLYSGETLGDSNTMFLGTAALGSATIAGHSDDDWRFTVGTFLGVTGDSLYIGNDDSHIWYDGNNLNIQMGGASLSNTLNSLSSDVNSILQYSNDMSYYHGLREQYLSFIPNEGLIIGDINESEQNSFQTKITSTEMQFLQNGVAIAYVSGYEFNIQNGVIQQGGILRIGNFVFAPDTDGSFGLRYSPLSSPSS